ncbi:hypothetical protein C8F01DRAFT_953691, partial [Mycena amicta]
CPAEAAQWFSEFYQRLTHTELGHQFDAIINAWIRMEEASLFKSGSDVLPTTGRPSFVAGWLRAKSVKPPKVAAEKVVGLLQALQAWWDTMQPQWRKQGSDGQWYILASYGGGGTDWGKLFTWGPGGVVGIVGGLYVAGCAIKAR